MIGWQNYIIKPPTILSAKSLEDNNQRRKEILRNA
jgi:hypothetical protein